MMKSFVDFSENLEDKKQQLMQKQKVMQQMERERASRSNQEFQQDREEKQSRIDQEKEEKKKLEQMKKEIKREIQQELEDEDIEEGIGKRLAAAGAAAVLASSGAAKAKNYSGQVNLKYGSTPSQVTNKSISRGVDKSIKNFGKGSGGSTVEKKGRRGLSGGVNISMSGGSSESTPTKTKVKPDRTKDPNDKVKPHKTTDPKTPTTVTQTPKTNRTTTNRTTNRTTTTNRSSGSNSNGSSKVLQKGSYSMGEEFGKMTKKQSQAYTGMDDKEEKSLYKKMKKAGHFNVKKNLAGAASDDKDLGESVSMKDVKKLRKAASLDMSKNPKDWESARARRTEIDFKDLMRQKKKGLKEEEISTPKYEDSRKDMQDFTSFMEASKTCPKGKYYCFDEKKCKPIPNGYRIGYGGRLAPDNRSDSGNGGNGNGNSNGHSNGNGSNGNGSGNGNGGNGGNGGGGGNGGNGG